jgi:hypothetical protein
VCRGAASAAFNGHSRLDDLRLGHEPSFCEARRIEHAQRAILASTNHRLGDDPADGRCQHEAVTAEARGNPDAVTHAPEDRLVVRRDVVHPLYECGERHEDKLRKQVFESPSHIRTP